MNNRTHVGVRWTAGSSRVLVVLSLFVVSCTFIDGYLTAVDNVSAPATPPAPARLAGPASLEPRTGRTVPQDQQGPASLDMLTGPAAPQELASLDMLTGPAAPRDFESDWLSRPLVE